MIRNTLIIIFWLVSTTSFSQTFFSGLERMCWINDSGEKECYDEPRNWYYLNTLLVDNDSLFMYKVPVQIESGDTLFSASDGAFFYYFGRQNNENADTTAILTMYNCDYCVRQVRIDSITDFMFPMPKIDTFKVSKMNNKLILGDVIYEISNRSDFFPPKNMFYPDSNSIYRVNPKGQYDLISIGIKNFLQTQNLKLDNNSLIIGLDIIDDGEKIETLNPDLLSIDTLGLDFKYYSLNELDSLVNISKRVVRYVEIGEIIDYWAAARISLTYKILIPKEVSNFKEKQYSCLLEYKKAGMNYLLRKDYIHNGWELIEQ